MKCCPEPRLPSALLIVPTPVSDFKKLQTAEHREHMNCSDHSGHHLERNGLSRVTSRLRDSLGSLLDAPHSRPCSIMDPFIQKAIHTDGEMESIITAEELTVVDSKKQTHIPDVVLSVEDETGSLIVDIGDDTPMCNSKTTDDNISHQKDDDADDKSTCNKKRNRHSKHNHVTVSNGQVEDNDVLCASESATLIKGDTQTKHIGKG